MKYSSFIQDLQKDSDEEGVSENVSNVELPFQEESHFKKIEIKYRDAEFDSDCF